MAFPLTSHPTISLAHVSPRKPNLLTRAYSSFPNSRKKIEDELFVWEKGYFRNGCKELGEKRTFVEHKDIPKSNNTTNTRCIQFWNDEMSVLTAHPNDQCHRRKKYSAHKALHSLISSKENRISFFFSLFLFLFLFFFFWRRGGDSLHHHTESAMQLHFEKNFTF